MKTPVCTFDLYLFSPREYDFLNGQLVKASLIKQTEGCPISCLTGFSSD